MTDIKECNICFNKAENESSKNKILQKLHVKFAYPIKAKLKKLMIDANVRDNVFDNLADRLYNICEICKQLKTTPPQPVVALPLTSEFIYAVAIELKQ